MQIARSPIFDRWLIPHVAIPIWLVAAFHARWKLHWLLHVALWACVSYGWETAEHSLQASNPQIWGGTEHPINAWIVDPISNGVGWTLGVVAGSRPASMRSLP